MNCVSAFFPVLAHVLEFQMSPLIGPSPGVSAEDVFLMSSKDPKNPVIYAVFTTSRYLLAAMATAGRVIMSTKFCFGLKKKLKKKKSKSSFSTFDRGSAVCCSGPVLFRYQHAEGPPSQTA